MAKLEKTMESYILVKVTQWVDVRPSSAEDGDGTVVLKLGSTTMETMHIDTNDGQAIWENGGDIPMPLNQTHYRPPWGTTVTDGPTTAHLTKREA